MSSRQARTSAVGLAAALLLALSAPAHARLLVGDVLSYESGSPHPYAEGHEGFPVVHREEISAPGATFLRIHFSEFNLALGDFVVVSDADGGQRQVYLGRGLKDERED